YLAESRRISIAPCECSLAGARGGGDDGPAHPREASMTTQWRWLAMLAFLLTALVAGAKAAPPTFRISQVFTTIDGGTQFVELTEFAGLSGQHQWRGLTLTMTYGDRA